MAEKIMSERMKTATELVQNPGEHLTVELKPWLDLDNKEHQAKVVKAVIALRNINGGHLLIGFDDDPPRRLKDKAPDDVQSRYHFDKLQPLVMQYAAKQFDIFVDFPEVEGQEYPVVTVRGGVKTPVAVRAGLSIPAGKRKEKTLLEKDAVYVRTTTSNGTASTSRARGEDWERIVEICMDNREADIGRFARRHLGEFRTWAMDILRKALETPTPSTPGQACQVGRLLELLQRVQEAMPAPPEEHARRLLDKGNQRFLAEAQVRKAELDAAGIDLNLLGTWSVAALVPGQTGGHEPLSEEYVNALFRANPKLTGWPLWIDSRGFAGGGLKPYTRQEGWEAFVLATTWSRHLDFWRVDAGGRLFHLRAMEDDLEGPSRGVEPGSRLEFGIVLWRTIEAMAVVLAFARAVNVNSNAGDIRFAFRWSRLKGRSLSAWANPRRFMPPGYVCNDDEVTSEVSVPVATEPTAVAPFVHAVLAKLFAAFSGMDKITGAVVEQFVREIMERR